MKITSGQRGLLVHQARWLISSAAQVHYAEIRPMRSVHLTWAQVQARVRPGYNGISMDCSEAVTCLFKWSGLKDPCGMSFDGYGNTDSMLSHLPHYADPKQALAGGLVIFARPAHVAMVIEPGHDPLLFSHGGESGPLAIRLSAERKYHASIQTFLSIVQLG